MWSYELQAASVNSDTSGKYYIPQGFSPPSPLQDSVSWDIDMSEHRLKQNFNNLYNRSNM